MKVITSKNIYGQVVLGVYGENLHESTLLEIIGSAGLQGFNVVQTGSTASQSGSSGVQFSFKL